MFSHTVDGLISSFNAKNGSLVTIRPAQPEDASGIVNAAECVLRTGKYIQKEAPRTIQEEREFIKKMHEDGNMYTAVELDNKVVGIARVIRGDLAMKKHTGVFRTWLIEEAQGLGIGSNILKFTLKWCEINRLNKLWLTVFSSNQIASTLYQKKGFVIEGVQKDQLKINGKYEDEIFMAYFFGELSKN
ncbi:GNAT family N-acetyltransferase [Bacillus timonensis]|nr:GNAT family N-acetyltransferase [Bacillus timonensis]